MTNKTKGRAPANKTIALAEDKVWDDKRRKAIRRPKRGQPLTIEQYNAGYEAYVIEQTHTHVAKAIGINPRTAKRYIEEGDPARGLRPYKLRHEKALQAAQTKEDYDLTKMRTEMLVAARALFGKMVQRIRALAPVELDADKLPTNLKHTFEIMRSALGEADQTIRHQVEDRYATWTLEEMMHFVQTGTPPPHAAGAPAALAGENPVKAKGEE